jgi:hypothetical protein
MTSGANESKAMGKCIASKRSREPPVFIGLQRDLRLDECGGAAAQAPKRLPSRRWAIVRGYDTNQLFSKTKRRVPPYANPVPSC